MEVKEIKIKRRDDLSYKIHIKNSILKEIPFILEKESIGESFAIISDSNVSNIYGKELLRNLKKKKISCKLFSFPFGERNKNLKTVDKLIDDLVNNGFHRKSLIIALGGGVTGDIAGFVASTYMRSIPYIQIPTTLLSMVDSSIGGKVGVDTLNAKNICGYFYQPRVVFIDPALLSTLPIREYINGLAEVIKHSIIGEKELFSILAKNQGEILKKDLEVVERIVSLSLDVKKSVVERDEREKDLRKILNYGHTIGHGLEVMTGFKKFLHGEALAIGMRIEGNISNILNYLSKDDLLRQNDLLDSYNLPKRIPKFDLKKFIIELRKDKKRDRSGIQFVLPDRIGKMKKVNGRYGINISESITRDYLKLIM